MHTPRMIKTPLALAMIAASSVSVSTAFAQDSGELLETTEVWGTKVRASSVFMNRENIEMKQADHISDLLRTIPGVDVGGAHSLNQRITIRSMDDKDIKITIDGANQNTYMFHHMGNLQIHADILQEVDINVGTNSVTSGGLGGSVRFETKQAKELLANGERFGGRVKATGSTNGSDDAAISFYGDLGAGIDLLGYYNHVEKSNFEVGGGKIKDQNGNEVAGTDGEVHGLKGELDDVLVKLGWDINNNHRLELGYEYYLDSGDYSQRPDMGLATDKAIAEALDIPLLWPTEFSRDTFTLNYDGQWGDNTEVAATLFQNDSKLWRDERGYATAPSPRFQAWAGIVEGDADNSGFNISAVTDIDSSISHQLTYGLEYTEFETAYKAKYPAATEQSSESKDDTSVYLQDRIEFNDVFAVIPGVRYDSVDVDSTVVKDTFDQVSGALALEVQPSDAFLIRLSSTELFQSPELSEVFVGAGLYDTANPDIEAETGLNTELSVAYGDAVLGADSFTAGATFFRTEIDDYIYDYAVPDQNNPRAAWKDNIGDMEVDGFELYTGYDIGKMTTLLTYSSSESSLSASSQYSQYEGARLDRTQGDTVSFKLGYEFVDANVKVYWDFMIVDDLDSVESNEQLDGAGSVNSKDGYQIHNISANWQPVQGLSLTLGVDNLFDKYYVSQSSRTGESFHPVFGMLYLNDYEPGRNVKATVSYQF